jgi:outer membrane biosynthesis protein TonB
MVNRWLVVLALALFSLTATARGPGAVRKQVETSMMLTGSIEVSKDGDVTNYTLDKVDELPPGIVKFVRDNVDSWKFHPVTVQGKAVAIHNKMNLLLVAKKETDGQYTLRLQAASFGAYQPEADRELTKRNMDPPTFPSSAAREGVTGTVYLVLKIGRSGKVEDVVVEQVNLRIVDSENSMERYRRWLADASLQAARNWAFIPPTKGEQADAPFWSIRVPVDYRFHGTPDFQTGKWEAYVPGPRQPYPWAENEDARYSPEALAAGGVHMVGGQGLRLLTPLGEQG